MDGKRPGPLSDSALDRELDAALNVDPSPEFLARVRMRVASEMAPAPWRLRWLPVTVGAALAAMAIAALVSYWPVFDVAVPREASAPAAPVMEPAPLTPPIAPTTSSAPARPRPAGVARPPAIARVDRRTGEAPLPDVVISRDEQRAFELLLTAIRQGELPPLPDAGDAATEESPMPAALEIAPVIVEPLPQIARLE